MTDLKYFVSMLNNSQETFAKEKRGTSWVIEITSRQMQFYFNADESFSFCCNGK